MTTDASNLLYTDVEDSLRESVRDLLRSRCPAEAVVGCYDGDRSLTPPLWRSLAQDLGLAGLLVPEDRGGAGGTPREAAVVLEELGRFVAPVPFLTSAVLAVDVLQAAGTDGGLLVPVASGERTAALAVPFSSGPGEVAATVRASGEGVLEGSVTSVAGALEADLLLVPVATDQGVEVHAVETGAVSVRPVTSLDMTRQLADVELAGTSGRLVLDAAAGAAAVRRALLLGAALLASEQVGVAAWCLEETVGYLKQRRQFGRVLGGFQALKHRLADLYASVESARAAARHAADTAATGDADQEVAASLAQAFCSDVAVHAAEECVQLHGGIGMTWEHPAHLYLKRAKADQIALGTPGRHRALLADLVDLPPAG